MGEPRQRLTRRQRLFCLWACVPVLLLVSVQALDWAERHWAWNLLYGACTGVNVQILWTLWSMHTGSAADNPAVQLFGRRKHKGEKAGDDV